MTTYRFKFIKGEEVKFTGHLDIMQAFQRALKRADLPICYSNGFNPHQQLSFAAPLSLGYTSTGDYGDFKLENDMEPNEVMCRLNNVMPDGLKILELIRLKDGVKNTMASVAAAKYIAVMDKSITPKDVEKNIEGFLKQEEILVMKKTKNNFKEADIKQDILELYNRSYEEQAVIAMTVSSGSVRNLKPESVAEAFCNFIGKEYNRFKTGFVREEMLMENHGKLVTLTSGVEKE